MSVTMCTMWTLNVFKGTRSIYFFTTCRYLSLDIQTPEVSEKSSGKPQGIFQTTNLTISKEIKYVGS